MNNLTFFGLIAVGVVIISTRPIVGWTEIKASSNACFSSTDQSLPMNYKFNAPYTGVIQGVRLVHNSGGTRCSGSTSHTAWGGAACGIRTKLLRLNDGATAPNDASILYPTLDTNDVSSISYISVSNCGCNANQAVMSEYSASSDEVIFYSDATMYDVTANDEFVLGICEGVCQTSTSDNSGTSCAEVYFLYSSVGEKISCRASGDPHFSSWDGSKHHFQGEAYYDYITKCDDDDLFPFIITAKQEECGRYAPMTCINEIRVTLGDNNDDNDGVIVFTDDSSANPTWLDSGDSAVGNEQTFTGGTFSVAPGKFSGTFMDPDLTGNNSEVTISFTYSGFNFEATATKAQVFDRICGLCGNVNGDSTDDFQLRDGTTVSNEGAGTFRVPDDAWTNTFTFGDSWCNSKFTAELEDTDIESSCVATEVPSQPSEECLEETAIEYCELLWGDYCSSDCGIVVSYEDWLPDCIFDSCILSAAEETDLSNYDYQNAVLEGFFDSSISECEVFCNATTSGICNPDDMFLTCDASGDPHFSSWDGSKHHFQGEAYYDYITKCNEWDLFPFTISVKQDECGQWAPMTCISEVRVVLDDDYDSVIVFSQDGNADPTWLSDGSSAVGDDQEFSGGSFSIAPGVFKGSFVDPDFDNAEITITFAYHDYYFQARTSYGCNIDRLCGICGTVNGNMSDDFQLRDGTIISNEGSEQFPMPDDVWTNTFTFGDSWCNSNFTAELSEEEGIISQCVPTPVPTQPTVECLNETALLYCEYIWTDHCVDTCDNGDDEDDSSNTTLIDYGSWLENCVFDTCVAGGDNLTADYSTLNNSVNSTIFAISVGECVTFCELELEAIETYGDGGDDDDEDDTGLLDIVTGLDRMTQLIAIAVLLCCIITVCCACCRKSKSNEKVSAKEVKAAVEVLSKVQSQSPSPQNSPGTPQSGEFKFS